VGLAACGGDDDTGDAERFCGEVAEHQALLTRPQLGSEGDVDDDIDELLDEYRRIGRFAPLAVEDDWDQLTAAYEAAAAVDPDDPDAEQEALEEVFRSERAAVAIAEWLRTTCGIDLGPIITIVPEVGATTTTTTAPARTRPPAGTTSPADSPPPN
jgi:hypothetical protein